MNVEEFRTYCLSKYLVTEEFPFDETTLVFKVAGKMFALTGLDDPEFKVNLKCDPDRALELREEYESIKEGYHMNKKHWNTVTIDGSIPDEEIISMINDSYDLVTKAIGEINE